MSRRLGIEKKIGTLLVTLLLAMCAVEVASADVDDPVQADATESPAFSELPPVEPADPEEPLESTDPDSANEDYDPGFECIPTDTFAGPAIPYFSLVPICQDGYAPVQVRGVTVSSSTNVVRFRNADGYWYILKSCLDRIEGIYRYSAGPGYIYRFIDNANRVLVNDYRARTDVGSPGYINAVHGGLGTFGWHHARGPILGTPAGDDPTTPQIEQLVDRAPPGYAIEGRMCAPRNSGYGVYARSWAGPTRISNDHIAFTMDVWLRDGLGNTGYGPGGHSLARLRYRYSFYKSSVKLWTSVFLYPRRDVGGVPFVKEPKFAAVLRGGGYKRIATFGGSDGRDFQSAVMKGRPEGTQVLTTAHSNAPSRTRVRWDYSTSLTAEGTAPCSLGHCFNVVMRAYASPSDGAVVRYGATTPWDNTSGLGLDGWAVASASRAKTWERDTRGAAVVTSCGAPVTQGADEVQRSLASAQASPSRDLTRQWEHGGWKEGGTEEANENPYDAAFTFFLGWQGGRGPGDCEPLERTFGTGQEAWGGFASFSLADGWALG